MTDRTSRTRRARGRASIVIVALGAWWLALAATPAGAATVNGRIVFAADIRGNGWQIYSMLANGTDVKQLSHLPPSDFADLMPRVSPDGTRIAFVSVRTGQIQIFTMAADGGNVVQVTHDQDPNHAALRPSWSPDGTKLLFARCTEFTCGIARIDADGSHLKQITPIGSSDFTPEYTPDGANIVFESQRQALISAVWVMGADGTGAHRITAPDIKAGAPDVSPDGRRIVFESAQNYPGPNEIYTVGLDGGGLTRLTDSSCCRHDVFPSWSPDGRTIVFASDRQYGDLCCLDVWRIRADGTHLRPVTSNLTPNGCDHDNCVYPDWGVAAS